MIVTTPFPPQPLSVLLTSSGDEENISIAAACPFGQGLRLPLVSSCRWTRNENSRAARVRRSRVGNESRDRKGPWRDHESNQRLPEASAMSNDKPTFVYEINGASFANLINGPRSYEDNLQRMVSLLGKSGRSTFSLSRLPDGQDIWDVTRESLPSVFLQAAGTAEAMTIEWRRMEQDG